MWVMILTIIITLGAAIGAGLVTDSTANAKEINGNNKTHNYGIYASSLAWITTIISLVFFILTFTKAGKKKKVEIAMFIVITLFILGAFILGIYTSDSANQSGQAPSIKRYIYIFITIYGILFAISLICTLLSFSIIEKTVFSFSGEEKRLKQQEKELEKLRKTLKDTKKRKELEEEIKTLKSELKSVEEGKKNNIEEKNEKNEKNETNAV